MRTTRIMGVAAAAATALGLTSAAYQTLGEARDRRKRPASGRLVDVGGYRLHILCAGQGSPAIVIIGALGASSAAWLDVQQRLAHETAVCVYDRAGLGWSDSPPRHRTGARMAGELHALLHAAGIAPPYVLVGHSLGGLVARIFASLYPDEVAGLALIDSSHPEQPQRLPRTHMRNYPGGVLLEATLEWMRPLGLRRMARDLGLRKTAGADWSAHRRADVGELLAFDAICREAGEVKDLGDLPLAVLTSAEIDPNYPSRRQRARSRFYVGWRVLQDELPALSADSTHVVAEYGGHHLNRDNAELVSEVVVGLVSRVRRGRSGEKDPGPGVSGT